MTSPGLPTPLRVETLILGGGITGASFFHVATRRGRNVVLLESEDFASGTSQASGMMVWGGLLYLRNLEFGLVRKLSRARDLLIRHCPERIRIRSFEFLPLAKGGRSRWFVRLGLELYRALSGFRRGPVRSSPHPGQSGPWRPGRFLPGLRYEEGFLRDSDALFALDWLTSSGAFARAFNHQEIESIAWRPGDKAFLVESLDRLSGERRSFLASKVVNCAGPWADSVNERWGMRTETRHHPSKGVYLVLPGDASEQACVMDMEHEGDTLCWTPWGPVVLWGPTETDATGPDDRNADPSDIEFLLERLRRNSAKPWTTDDILNVRVGVRPLALPPGTKVGYSLDLSRRALLEGDPTLPWWTAFGGKLSGCLDFAVEMHRVIHQDPVSPETFFPLDLARRPMLDRFFGGLSVVDPSWARDHETCRTLEDYLRRRTNIAQWIADGGLGRHGEFLDDLREIARILHGGDESRAEADLDTYVRAQTQQRRRWSHAR